jgi:hypothetical protein
LGLVGGRLSLLVIRWGSRVERDWPADGFERTIGKRVWVSCSGWTLSSQSK